MAAGVVAALTTSTPAPVAAHPGGTDSSGCHRCRSKCGKWGLRAGQYHCHGGGLRPRPSRPAEPKAPPGRDLAAPDARGISPGSPRPDAEDAAPPSSGDGIVRESEPPPSATEPRPATMTVSVVAAVDGDTVVARDAGTFYLLRLDGVDAPALDQPFGDSARRWLARHVDGKRVAVEPRGSAERRRSGPGG
ncbi:MAG: YHYH domain-containing protein, partial [Acidobacteriota bacterium]